MFCKHQKHVYHSCYDYYIYFNIQIHIALMSHYDMYQIILYTMHINYVTFILHMMITLMVYVYLFVIYHVCIIYLSVEQGQVRTEQKESILMQISQGKKLFLNTFLFDIFCISIYY